MKKPNEIYLTSYRNLATSVIVKVLKEHKSNVIKTNDKLNFSDKIEKKKFVKKYFNK